MIRVNLLTVEGQRSKRKRRGARIDLAQKVPIACSLILVGAGLVVGWWYWTLQEAAAQLVEQIAQAESEAARLRGLMGEVRKFEAERAQLAQRVALIDQLRQGQSGPVHMLDQISRNLPEYTWLTRLKQENADVTLEGRCLTMSAVYDFMNGLQSSGFFASPVELVENAIEPPQPGQPELVKFTIKARFAPPAG